MRVVPVQPNETEAWKQRLSWHFNEFDANGLFEPGELWGDVETMQRQLWVVEDNGDVKAAVLTRVSTDTQKTCDVTHAAGYDRASWQHLWPYLEAWARGIGCKRISAMARPGWERVLKNYGLEKTHVLLERSLL